MLVNGFYGKTATGLGPGIRFESGGELKGGVLAHWCLVLRRQEPSHRGGSSPPGKGYYVIVMYDLIVWFWVWLRTLM